MPGSPKKRASIAAGIRTGQIPPMKERIAYYAQCVNALIESAMQDADTMSSAARISMADKLSSIMLKMKDLGAEQLTEEEMIEINLPVILRPVKKKSGKSDD